MVVFSLASAAKAQSTSDLERQVLGGGSAPVPEPSAPAENSLDSSTTKFDESLPDALTNDSSAPSVQTQQVSDAAPAPKKEDDNSKEKLKAVDEAVTGPHAVPYEHILVVQNRFIRKEGLHEITPFMVGWAPADSFREQLQFGFGYTYHLTESFGIEALHFNYIKNFSTGLNDTIRRNAGLETDRIEPVFSAGSALLWTPLKSKAATDDSIYYFEGYFLAGGGVVRYEDEFSSMAMLGMGFRVYLSRDSIFKAELRDYADFHGNTNNRLNLIAGISLLLGREGK